LTQAGPVRYRSAGMTRVAFATWLAGWALWVAPGLARGDEELLPPPTVADAGAEPANAPQLEDREAPPMPGQKQAKPAQKSSSEPKNEPKPVPAEPKKAAKPVEAAPEAPLPPPTATPPRITAHAFDEDSAGVLAERVEGGIAEELSADARLRWVSKADLLTPPEQAPRLLGEADLQSMDAEDALTQGDVEKAKQLLEKALRTYQSYLPQLAVRGGGLEPFRDAWMRLARARFFDGDQKGARDAMRFVFVLDPNIRWDPKHFPAAMKKVVVEARLLFDTLGAGTLNIDSDPPGATVYLNGKKLDKTTPAEGVPAPPGPNYISYVRRDWVPVSAIFEVAGGGEVASAVRSLEHFPGRPLQPLFRAQKELDRGEAPPTLKESAAKLNVDMMVLVRLERGEGGTHLYGYLYDARPDRILKRADKTAPEDTLSEAAHDLAKELLSSVRLDGTTPKPVVVKKPSSGERMAAKWREFRHSKAFWYVVGGVAGAIVVGTAVGVGVGVGGHEKHGLTPGEQLVLIGGN
jgi:outer membrane biosynthesis protein TonB